MTGKFVREFTKESRKTKTENGANAFNTTKNGLVDLFGIIGALRGQNMSRLHIHIDGAYAENPELLAKMLFQTRDIRGGLGERDTFCEAINYCAKKYPGIVEPNIALIPEYGRWDDMFALIGTPLEHQMFAIMREQLDNDAKAIADGKSPSLLAKWLPTADASSESTRDFAKVVAKGLGYPGARSYKNAYKPIRKALNTVEAQMTAKKWNEITYPTVPSNCMLKHISAFARNDHDRYEEYVNAVRQGKEKINATTLYPYDIIEKVFYGEKAEALDVLWNALPNYVEGEKNFLVMADVSGSMRGRPIATSIGLALYFAQRNKGDYNGLFMTFSDNPELVRINPNSNLVDTVCAMEKANWDMSTNLEGAFDKILDMAIKSKSKQEDLPEALIIITDMEFNSATCGGDVSFMKAMRQKFKDNGYKMPNIVFWNVNSRHDTYHASSDKEGIVMVSGHSVSTFGNLMAGLNGKTPYEFMVETLMVPRYEPIKVAVKEE